MLLHPHRSDPVSPYLLYTTGVFLPICLFYSFNEVFNDGARAGYGWFLAGPERISSTLGPHFSDVFGGVDADRQSARSPFNYQNGNSKVLFSGSDFA